ncbi:EamA family transporter [Flavobacterium sp.]|jgi:drug/metabolite transporter (DMT)-like permease|uniref:EamA family transporter n=1 Tax=Flavobacterium sp. TaxID=239 RepID=UPI0037BF8DC1
MLYVLLSVFCSVFVGVILKLAKKKPYSFFQIITFNYVIATLLTYFVCQPEVKTLTNSNTIAIILLLSFLLPIIFVFQAKAIKYSGIVKTDIAQRMSLFLSLLFSYFIANENFGTYKWLGIGTAFLAIFLTFYRKNDGEYAKRNKWFFLAFVLFGFGIIDILFKKIASLKELQFTEILLYVFPGALVVSIFISIYYLFKGKESFHPMNIWWGIGVGILNFGNISFYIKAHQVLSSTPSTVFASMNMGVIVLGSIIGIIAFKEKVNRWNYVGLFLSLVAIAIITYTQM